MVRELHPTGLRYAAVVGLQCLLLRHIIEAEEKGGEKSEEEPHMVEKREKEKKLKIKN